MYYLISLVKKILIILAIISLYFTSIMMTNIFKPFNINNIYYIPYIELIVIYYFLINFEINKFYLFLISITLDIIYFTPLGVNGLLLIIISNLTNYNKHFIKYSKIYNFILFICYLIIMIIGKYIILLLISNYYIPFHLVIYNIMLTICFYPIIMWLLRILINSYIYTNSDLVRIER